MTSDILHVALVGDAGTGKSSFIRTLRTGSSSLTSSAEENSESVSYSCEVDKIPVVMSVSEVPGSLVTMFPKLQGSVDDVHMKEMALPSADVIIVMFAVVDEDSFNHVKDKVSNDYIF
jgi:GTPase SAR1 family protein